MEYEKHYKKNILGGIKNWRILNGKKQDYMFILNQTVD